MPVEPRKRYVYVIDCREATEACTRRPLTVDPSGVWFRPEGRLFLCGKSPEEDEEPPATDLDTIDHAFFEQRGVAAAGRARAGFRERQGGERLGRATTTTTRSTRTPSSARTRTFANFYFANGFSGHGAQQAAGAGRAIAELIVHGAFQTIDLTRLGYARIAANRPLFERNVI